ncbi:MAG: ATP-binding protein, partial [Melioribacteraceae bacterium]|nr:ATP-binding protein [Melioribacteraceae bacterium]
MKKRFLFTEFKKYLDHKNALIITGMRQVGKTTLIKQLFDETEGNKIWFDFENPLHTLQFENIDYDAIYTNLSKKFANPKKRLFVFIDEIQNYPPITKIIKYLIDTYKVKFILTGSSNFYMKNLFPESLSGRKFLFILPPLSFSEFLYFRNKTDKKFEGDKINFSNLTNKSLPDYKEFETDYNDYLQFGGFPEVALTSDIKTKSLVLNNIFSSFYEKDLKILSDFKDVRELRDLILLLVPRTGNILDITKISSELSVSRTKLYSYIEFLEAIFLIKLIPKLTSSIDRSVAGGKKIYFADNGLLNIIARVNEGQLFENAIANQLSPYGDLSFYNKRNTSEIDFILNKKTAFEVKLNAVDKD